MLTLDEQFKHMNISESTDSNHFICLTSYTNKSLNVTLTGLVSLIKMVLETS